MKGKLWISQKILYYADKDKNSMRITLVESLGTVAIKQIYFFYIRLGSLELGKDSGKIFLNQIKVLFSAHPEYTLKSN